MCLSDFGDNLGGKMDTFGKQLSQTQKIENPSKTIVFRLYFEGRALKYYLKIIKKTKQNRASKSINRNK